MGSGRGGTACGLGGEYDDLAISRKRRKNTQCPIDIDTLVFFATPCKKNTSREQGVGGSNVAPSGWIGVQCDDIRAGNALSAKLTAEFFRISERSQNACAMPHFLNKHIAAHKTGCAGEEQRFHARTVRGGIREWTGESHRQRGLLVGFAGAGFYTCPQRHGRQRPFRRV